MSFDPLRFPEQVTKQDCFGSSDKIHRLGEAFNADLQFSMLVCCLYTIDRLLILAIHLLK